MTLFLRDEKNRTLVDIELYKKDGCVEISSSVDIENYSRLLLSSCCEIKQQYMITHFDFLSELRGWLWERYFSSKKNTVEEYDNVVEEVRKILDEIGSKIGLHRIED